MRTIGVVLLIAVSMGIAYAIVQGWWQVIAMIFLLAFLAIVLCVPSPPRKVLRFSPYSRDE